MKLSFRLNGEPFEAEAPPSMSLADLLRSIAGVRSIHLGCEQGVCGACTVLVDGGSARSCLMLGAQVQGRSVTTAEGVPAQHPESWSAIEAALVERNALQCGFCTPAMVVCLEELLGRGKPVSLDAVLHHLSGQLCRCTGYTPVLDAFWEILGRAGLTSDENSSRTPIRQVQGHATKDRIDDRGRFTRGGGRYVADLALPDDVLAVGFVRSAVARARILSVDLDSARRADGVVAAFAPEDLENTLRSLPVRYGPGRLYDWQLLARSSVSYVGEPLAVVVGTNRAAVEEAIDLADIEYEPLSPVLDIEKAREGSSGIVRPETGTNVIFSLRREEGDVDGAFANAEFVIKRRYHLGRHSASPLENRGVLAYQDVVTGEMVVCTSTQIPHVVRQAIATVLGRREDSVRVLVPDVGGGFGLKAQVGAEECVVACVAQHLGRRVAWIEDRWENLAASNHAHDEWLRLTVGFTGSGVITGMDAEVLVDIGAHSAYPLSAALEPSTVSSHLFGCYRMPAARLAAFGVTTNKCPTGAYRGVGASVASFATERLLDDAAAEIGLSRVEIRRRNLLGRADMPYHHAIGGRMNCSDPLGVFDHLLTSLDSAEPWLASAIKARGGRWQEPRPGPLVGIGVAVCAEHSAPGSADYRGRGVTEVPGYDSARVVFEEAGTFTVYISSAEAGQQHAAVCRRQVAAVLGVDLHLIRVVEGDTAACPVGTGTFASRFAAKQVTAALAGASRMAERLRLAAASYLRCSSDEIRQAEGGYEHPASGGQVSLAKLGEWLYRPPGATPVQSSGVPVEELGYADGEAALSCGALLTVVEVDPRSFVTKVRAISVVEECGRVLDRDLAVGQLVGGAVMGLGDALLEEHLYDDLGQITTSSLMDYLLPSFGDAPRIKVSLLEDESLYTEHSWTGSKGVGEGGTIGAVAAIGCAVSDALAPLGATLNELPGTPQRLFRACGNPATPNSGVDQLGGESAPSPHEYRLR